MRGNHKNRVVYSFMFSTNENIPVKVKFYNLSTNPFCGSDHSTDHSIRRDWALSVLESPPWKWLKLPSHPFILFLKNNDFVYSEYLIIKNKHKIQIFVR